MAQTENDRLEILRLSFAQGMRGLDSQESTLAAIRQTGAAVAAINGLSATFLGKHVLDDGKVLMPIPMIAIGAFELVALLALAASILSVAQLYWPRDGWIFHFGPRGVIDQFANGPNATTLSKTYEELSRFAEDNYATNEHQLRSLFRWLTGALVWLALQIGGWLIALAHRGAS